MKDFKQFVPKFTTKNIKSTAFLLGTSFFLTGMISCGSADSEALSPTQGVVTKVKEIETESFKITDEQIVENKEDSRIIATYLDGKIDTFTLEQASLVDESNPRRRSSRGILMGGMMGYMMGKSMSSPMNRSSFASDDAFKKSNTKSSSFKSTAKRSTVNSAKKGFGSSKSTRSFGG